MSNTLNKFTNKISINKLQNTLNELIDRNDLNVRTTESNELLETLKILENCASCKDKKIDWNDFKKCLAELKKEEQGKRKENIIDGLNNKLNKIDFELNKWMLCEGCKGKKINKLTDRYGNEKIARFLYHDCKLNARHYDTYYVRWIPFDEFKNIKYLAKGGFGEVHKATWINSPYKWYEMRYYECYEDMEVVLKRIYNNSSDDKIVDILKEVK